MKKKYMKIALKTAPMAYPLKRSAAASIGKTITRYTYLESILADILYAMLGISKKQGRVAVRLPPTSRYLKTLEELMEFHKVKIKISGLHTILDKADRARNDLAHSIYINDNGVLKIQLVRGSWDFDDQSIMSVARGVTPQTPKVDRAFLTKKRRDVEIAIRAAKKFSGEIGRVLASSNEKRRTQPEMDRRRHAQT